MNAERRHQVENLHHAALQQPPENRAAFLKPTSAGNDDLCSDLESLLAEDGSALATKQHIPAGTKLGPYEIIGPIGAGGMARSPKRVAHRCTVK